MPVAPSRTPRRMRHFLEADLPVGDSFVESYFIAYTTPIQ
jgi:hypothetical protein